MKLYLSDIGYSSSNMVRLEAKPEGNGAARMSCSPYAPCFNAQERQWPDKIGFSVNTNSESLLTDTSVDKVAALIIHELSHSTAIASRKNLVVEGSDVPMTQANV